MFPFSIAAIFLGYALTYWGAGQIHFKGKGQSFAQVLGLEKETVSNTGNGSANLMGQPAAPGGNGGVWT